MGYVTGNQGRPIQGVSQQPEKTRLLGQCTKSDNFRPDVVRGLINRPGTDYRSKLDSASMSDSVKWHYYNRGAGDEEYIISIAEGGVVGIWSPDGTKHTINSLDNTAAYLASYVTSPKEDILLYTVGDYTFLINKTIDIYQGSSFSPAKKNEALIYVQFADYSQDIRVTIDGVVVAHYRTSDAQDSGRELSIRPGQVVNYLVRGMQGLSGTLDGTDWYYEGVNITANFVWDIYNNVIHIRRIDGADFTISVSDDANNNNVAAIKGKLKDTTMLPGHAPIGWVVEIDPPGSDTLKNASYYLKATASDGEHVTWKETIAPSTCLGFSKDHMPHVLVRDSISGGVATFSMRHGEWKDREVGNDDTNPLPSFCDSVDPKPIESVGIFQNRLFFTSGENVVMTQSSDFFNFFRETAQASLDTDPIDIFADSPDLNYIHASAAMDGDLILFSNHAQFIMDGSKAITPANATLIHATSFDALQGVTPVVSGDNIFFPFNYGGFTGVREFFTDSTTDTKRARPITDHVKQYIKGKAELMKSSTSDNLLLIKTEEDQNIIYTYDWLWQGTEKVQSAWGRWVFSEGSKVKYFTFHQQTLVLVIQRESAVWVESIDMGDQPDEFLGFQIRMDRKLSMNMTKNTDNGIWYVLNPYPSINVDNMKVILRNGPNVNEGGTEIDFYISGDYILSEEDIGETVVNVVVGEAIKCEYIPTNPVALDEKGYALNLDKLIIGAFYMNYNYSGDVTATITDFFGVSRTLDLSYRVLGDSKNKVGFAALGSGQHRVPIRKRSDGYTLTYSYSSHLPLEVRDFEYNGNLNRRGRRV